MTEYLFYATVYLVLGIGCALIARFGGDKTEPMALFMWIFYTATWPAWAALFTFVGLTTGIEKIARVRF